MAPRFEGDGGEGAAVTLPAALAGPTIAEETLLAAGVVRQVVDLRDARTAELTGDEAAEVEEIFAVGRAGREEHAVGRIGGEERSREFRPDLLRTLAAARPHARAHPLPP